MMSGVPEDAARHGATGPYELFISYSRQDNVPRRAGDNRGWVTALRDEILADHRRFSTEPLRIFFDTSVIATMDDWRHRILIGLRESKILLVCLSPDYFKSPPCLWEWEEYLTRQIHALMGQESVAPVYFVEAPDSDQQLNAAWAEAVTRKVVAPTDRSLWEARWKAWREATLGRPNWVDLKPWFPHGIEALREVAVRDKIAALCTSLWERIQRARRATGVPGNLGLRRPNPHFIGRHAELRRLHENLSLGAVGVVTAVHGLGGQGKTELAVAYAHGWADCYAAGLWVLDAEGEKAILPLLGKLCTHLQIPVASSPDEPPEGSGRRVLAELRRRVIEVRQRSAQQMKKLESNLVEARSDGRNADAARIEEEVRFVGEQIRTATCLVLLDNVSDPSLLSEPQLAQLPREDWLRVVVTTREGPGRFSASHQKSLVFVPVDALTTDDASRLIEDHQPEGKWPDATAGSDAAAATEIARELGGFTLAVESVAIFLGLNKVRPVEYLARLRREGLPSVDALPASADVAAQIHHREKQLRVVIDQTLARLTPPERTALDYAALLPPDSIPWPWLYALTKAEHHDALATNPGYPDPWLALRRRLEGLRLLGPGDHPEIARMHRLVAAHIGAASPDHQQKCAVELVKHAGTCADALDPDLYWVSHGELWRLQAIADFAEHLLVRDEPHGVSLVVRVARPLVEHWLLTRAEQLLRAARLMCESQPTPDDRLFATVLNLLGDVLRERGEVANAEEVVRRGLNLALGARRIDHMTVARCQNNLAMTLQSTGDPASAEAHYRSALEAIEKSELPGVEAKVLSAVIWHNLADLKLQIRVRDRRALDEVRSGLSRALALLEATVDRTHPYLATARQALGVVLQRQGRPGEAAECHRRAVEAFVDGLGPQHARTGSARAWLGSALALSGQRSAAEGELHAAIQLLAAAEPRDRYGLRSLDGLVEDYVILLARSGRSRHEIQQSLRSLGLGRVIKRGEVLWLKAESLLHGVLGWTG